MKSEERKPKKSWFFGWFRKTPQVEIETTEAQVSEPVPAKTSTAVNTTAQTASTKSSAPVQAETTKPAEKLAGGATGMKARGNVSEEKTITSRIDEGASKHQVAPGPHQTPSTRKERVFEYADLEENYYDDEDVANDSSGFDFDDGYSRPARQHSKKSKKKSGGRPDFQTMEEMERYYDQYSTEMNTDYEQEDLDLLSAKDRKRQKKQQRRQNRIDDEE